METLSTSTETTLGIQISSWSEFRDKSKIFNPNSVVRGIRLFSSNAPTPHEVLEVIIDHPEQKLVFTHLLHDGEMVEGYLLDELQRYFVKYLPDEEEKIKLFNFRDYNDLLRFNQYLYTPSEE
jgi:hypothetical protein